MTSLDDVDCGEISRGESLGEDLGEGVEIGECAVGDWVGEGDEKRIFVGWRLEMGEVGFKSWMNNLGSSGGRSLPEPNKRYDLINFLPYR